MELVTPRSPVVALGEGMLELSSDGAGWRLGSGGDILNTATHMARLGVPVRFASAIGDDPFSAWLRTRWRTEGLDVEGVGAVPDRLPGLYAIHADADGERSFSYWRENSAARVMLAEGRDEAARVAQAAGLLVLSLITVAVTLSDFGRLLDLCRAVRDNGGTVAFDTNYRPRLWRSARSARDAVATLAGHVDIALPSQEDHAALFGGNATEAAAYWMAAGAGEVIVKRGREACIVNGTEQVEAISLCQADVIDTSGAGDAFNAAYLTARLEGVDPAGAAVQGHELASWVIRRRGALPDHEAGVYHLDIPLVRPID